jgi:hypothetical protein
LLQNAEKSVKYDETHLERAPIKEQSLMSVMVSGSVHRRQLPIGTVTSYLHMYLPGLPNGLFSNQKSRFGKKSAWSKIGKCGYILRPFGIFYGHLGYFMTIWHIVCSFFPVLVSCTKKNLATLVPPVFIHYMNVPCRSSQCLTEGLKTDQKKPCCHVRLKKVAILRL